MTSDRGRRGALGKAFVLRWTVMMIAEDNGGDDNDK